MKLKEAKQIQDLVNKFNQIRNESSRLPLALSVDKYDKGKWSVDIIIPTDGVLYSRECSVLFPLLAQLGCTFFIGMGSGDCVIYIQ